jgi:cell fate regulator YaaT (PSP1 superfamily)
MSYRVIVRYGVVPEVARFPWPHFAAVERGQTVIIRTRRGVEPGTVLEVVKADAVQNGDPGESEQSSIEHELRIATEHDLARAEELRASAQADFVTWQNRIRDWNLELELIDVEWMLDREKLVLYVLGGRGPDTTKLALQAAAAGFAIEVQPVNADGLVAIESGCGCGHGGTCGRE